MSEEKHQGMLVSMSKMFKYFFKGFYEILKRGAKEHKRGLQIAIPVIVLIVFILGFAFLKFSETAFFCNSCHNMNVYVESWRASTHKDVACTTCHYKPGFIEHMKGKWRDGQVSLVYIISGKTPPTPHAQIDDASCLQSGCHSKEKLKDNVVFKNVVFSHAHHLEEMKREKKLRCTTCHSQIVQGAHMTVTESDCFICHFYKTKGQKDYITGCTTCHFEAKGDMKVGDFTWNHKTYIKRGISCDKCHTNVINGDGHIKENACLQCHTARETLETSYTPEFLHRMHVTEHKVECYTCHALIKHETAKLDFTGEKAAVCIKCHKTEDHHDDVANMYLGKGAKFVEETPNRKASLHMDCTMCHEASRDKSHIANKCRGCHGSLTDGMVYRWKKLLKEKLDALSRDINETKKFLDVNNSNSSLKRKLDECTYNYAFILNANGTHNIIYSMKVIDATKNILSDIRAKASGTISTTKPFKLSCTSICHSNIDQLKVPFGSVTYPHAPHIDGDDSCVKCHSKYDNHGKTVRKGCSSCHHSGEMGKVTCKDCHKDEANMFKGIGVKGIKDVKSPMHGKTTCTSCHNPGNRSVASIKNHCLKCHKKGYEARVDEWIKEGKAARTKYLEDLAAIEKDIAGYEKTEGHHFVPLRAIFEEVDNDIKFISLGGFNHNFKYSKAIAEKTDKNLEALKKMLKDIKEGKKILVP